MVFRILGLKINLLLSFFIILAIAGCQEGGSITASNDLSSDGFGSIAGKLIVDKGITSDTGNFISLGGSISPASNVSVKLISTNAIIKTDSLGNYLFEKVPEGKHSLVAESGDFKAYIQNIDVKTGIVTRDITGTLAVCGGIEGAVQLAGQSDHDKIVVTLPYSKKTFYTNTSGAYKFEDLPAGIFTINISKYGFKSFEKAINVEPGRIFKIDDIILFPENSLTLKSDFTGELTSNSTMIKLNSPYRPTGDIIIPQGIHLIIEPGVEIIFPDNLDSQATGFFSGESQTAVVTQNEKLSEFMVKGSLSILGEVNAFVNIHTESDVSGTWGGIFFAPESTDNKCILLNCKISNAYCGIICSDSSPEFKNVIINNSLSFGLGITGASSNPLGTNLFIDDSNRGIQLNKGGAVVKNSIITGSTASGMIIENSSFFLFENSIVSNNSGGIEISNSNSVRIYDSLIGGNRYGILVSASNSVQIKNNVIVSNSEYGLKADDTVQVKYNNVYGNQSPGNTSKIPDGGNYMSVQSGYGDIQVTPNFTKSDFSEPDVADWSLNSESLLIGSGLDGKNMGLSNPDYIGIQQKVFFNE